MNVSSLSNSTYLQSLMNSAIAAGDSASTSGANSTSSIATQDGNPQISPLGQVLSTLQQLQQSNPAEYSQMTSRIAANLQSAANTATAGGNTAQAAQLNQLASDFTSASQNNTLPNVKDLAQAVGGGGHPSHHHHHVHASNPDNSSSNSPSDTALNPLTIIQNTLDEGSASSNS